MFLFFYEELGFYWVVNAFVFLRKNFIWIFFKWVGDGDKNKVEDKEALSS